MRSLLCRDDAERALLVDMSRRMQPVSRRAIGMVLVSTAICIPSFGWRPLVPIAIAAAVFFFIQTRLGHYRRPEYALAVTWLLAQAMVVAVIVVASGPRQLLFPLFAIPMMLASVVWPTRIVVPAVILSALALTGVAFATDPAGILSNPPLLTHQVALLVSIALVASISRDAEVASRTSVVVDSLTGTLNRIALDARARELEHQSADTGRGVAVIVGDVDLFKRVNDEHGHAAGDAALRAVAERLQRALPPFAALYRFGGEEFVALLPDTNEGAARTAAERMRAAVSAAVPAAVPAGVTPGVPAVTISLGVAASRPGERFSYAREFAAADGALYEAKARGRDNVRVAAPPDSRSSLRSAPAAVRPARAPHEPSPDVSGADGDEGAGAGSWLTDAHERRHLLELTRRLLHKNGVPFAVSFAAIVFLGPWYGWWPIAPVVLAAVIYRTVEGRLDRFRRPEYALGLGWMAAQVANTGAFFVVTSHPSGLTSGLFALPLMIIMVVGSSAVFPGRGVLVGGVFTALLMLIAGLRMDPAAVLHRPSELLISIAVLAVIGTIGCSLGTSIRHHRGEAITDGLTGLLNRRALESRSAELAHQTEATGEPVAIVLGDIDHFKEINDRHGHAAGDRALEGLAQRLRTQVRAFEGIYRFGGEEFAILLAGAKADVAVATAERLRAAVAASPVAGLPVTMSFGVAGTEAGECFDFGRLFVRADRALYEAKGGGRNRVQVFSGGDGPPADGGPAAPLPAASVAYAPAA
jgi:diguanylate cyclase (GGDEF)-like protein